METRKHHIDDSKEIGDMMILQQDNLAIRNATIEDADILCKWWNDGKVMAHAGFPNGLGTTSHQIAKDIAIDTDNTRRRLIIEKDATPIGEMCYYNKGNQVAEIGIKICETTQQEKGYGKRILTMLITYLFEELKYEKIILDTNLNNTRAQHVYESLGFQKTAVNIDSWNDQMGNLQSSVDYALSRREFIVR